MVLTYITDLLIQSIGIYITLQSYSQTEKGGPYVDYFFIIDKFSTYYALFCHEKAYIENNKPAGTRWSIWNKFCLLRDYFALSLLLHCLLVFMVQHYFTDQIELFDIKKTLIEFKAESVFALASLIVIVSFKKMLESRFVYGFIMIGCSFTRFVSSLNIYNKYLAGSIENLGNGAKGSISTISSGTLLLVTQMNMLNGGITFLSTTIVDIVFRGNFAPLKVWATSRTIFFSIPLVQILYVQFEIQKLYYEPFISSTNLLLKSIDLPMPQGFKNGFQVVTIFMVVCAYFYHDLPLRICQSLFKRK